MPTPFPDLRDFYDPALTLTIGGVEYRVAVPDQETCLALRKIVNGQPVTDEEYLDRIMGVLGAVRDDEDVYTGGLMDTMTEDGVSWPEVRRVAETAALHYGEAEDRARAWWSTELLAEATELALAEQASEVIDAIDKAKPARKARKGK